MGFSRRGALSLQSDSGSSLHGAAIEASEASPAVRNGPAAQGMRPVGPSDERGRRVGVQGPRAHCIDGKNSCGQDSVGFNDERYLLLHFRLLQCTWEIAG